MTETQAALYLGVFIGMIVMVITRPLADWITRAIQDEWRKHKEAQ